MKIITFNKEFMKIKMVFLSQMVLKIKQFYIKTSIKIFKKQTKQIKTK